MIHIPATLTPLSSSKTSSVTPLLCRLQPLMRALSSASRPPLPSLNPRFPANRASHLDSSSFVPPQHSPSVIALPCIIFPPSSYTHAYIHTHIHTRHPLHCSHTDLYFSPSPKFLVLSNTIVRSTFRFVWLIVASPYSEVYQSPLDTFFFACPTAFISYRQTQTELYFILLQGYRQGTDSP